jgi:hypothetical protein
MHQACILRLPSRTTNSLGEHIVSVTTGEKSGLARAMWFKILPSGTQIANG